MTNRTGKRSFLILAVIILVSNILHVYVTYASDTTVVIKRQKIGFVVGYGTQNFFPVNLPKIDEAIVYKYNVVLLQGQYHYSWVAKPKWSLEILVHPQFNLSTYRPVDTIAITRNGIEFGVNAGLLIRKNFFNDLFSIYGAISSGPHYVSGVPARQVPGYIFSDNFAAGVNVRMHRDVHLDLRYGYRHISNANLKIPNGGVNDMIWSVGFLKYF